MLLAGLTGGIGTGKSTFASFLRELGIPIIDCDAIAHDVVRKGTWGYRRVLRALPGHPITLPNGELDREAIAAIVFADQGLRRRLNAATHLPVLFGIIRQAVGAWLRFYPVAVVDMPLLFETGFYRVSRPNILIYTSTPDTQVARLQARDGLGEDAARARMAAQMPVERKRALADIAVPNDGGLEELRTRAAGVAATLRRRALLHRTLLSPAGVAAGAALLWRILH